MTRNFFSNFHRVSLQYFRPSHRSVSCQNFFLDRKTKNIVAQDRFVVKTKDQLKLEEKRSLSYLQLIASEERLVRKRSNSSTSSTSDTHVSRSNSFVDINSIRSNSATKTTIIDTGRPLPEVSISPPDD